MIPAARADGIRLSLSVLEKHLIRLGWRTGDFCDPKNPVPMVRATAPDGRCLTYADPCVLVEGQDRAAALTETVEQAAAILALAPQDLARQALTRFDQTPTGFACTLCGHCCQALRDAYQGRVSPEEVAAWQEAGLTRILNFVQRVDRPGYSFHRAWVQPKTGRYLKKCPWLTTLGEGRRGCSIHVVRPLKCCSFPFSREQAQYARCPGFGESDGENGR